MCQALLQDDPAVGYAVFGVLLLIEDLARLSLLDRSGDS